MWHRRFRLKFGVEAQRRQEGTRIMRNKKTILNSLAALAAASVSIASPASADPYDAAMKSP
jgi:hypothetical protein